MISSVILPSFAKTLNPVHSNQKAAAYLGYLYQGKYTVYINGDLQTGRVVSASVYLTSTGQEIGVQGIQNGGVSESGGVVRVNIKITTTDGGLIRVSGVLTK